MDEVRRGPRSATRDVRARAHVPIPSAEYRAPSTKPRVPTPSTESRLFQSIREQRDAQCIAVGAVVVEQRLVVAVNEKIARARRYERGEQRSAGQRLATGGLQAETLEVVE